MLSLMLTTFLALMVAGLLYNRYQLLRKQKTLKNDIDAFKAKDVLMDTEFKALMEIVDQRTRELEDQRALTFQASKMSALGEMAGGIAHEINNPLTIILGTIRKIKLQLSREEMDNEVLDKACTNIEAKALRISNIVERLKIVSRDSTNEVAIRIQLLDVLQDALSLCEEKFRMVGIDIQIDLEEPGFHSFLNARRAQLSQVFWNLLENSYEAVSLLPEKWIKIETHLQDSIVTVRITDSGPGIPAPLREKIFMPFFTTKEVGSGTGLGLTLSAAIVKNHQGDLSLDESSPNTSFVLKLPVV